MNDTPRIGAKLTLVDADSIVLNQWELDEWDNLHRSPEGTLGKEIYNELVIAAKSKARTNRKNSK